MLYICDCDENTPVTNLLYLNLSELFMCTCGDSIYLFHLDSKNLVASVNLGAAVGRIY